MISVENNEVRMDDNYVGEARVDDSGNILFEAAEEMSLNDYLRVVGYLAGVDPATLVEEEEDEVSDSWQPRTYRYRVNFTQNRLERQSGNVWVEYHPSNGLESTKVLRLIEGFRILLSD